MREFKFRAWDTKLNIMIFEDSDFEAIEQKYNDSCYWAGERYPCICPEAMFGLKMDRFIKMQCTGLKDINDVEIYEGDIAKDIAGFVYIVEWQNKKARFVYKCVKDGSKIKMNQQKDIEDGTEVIGNIYENPELVES